MAEYRGIDYLRRKLDSKRPRVLTRYRYYEMKMALKDLSPIMPDSFRWLGTVMGWCGNAVDALADRLIFEGFKEDNYGIGEIFDLNSKDTHSDSAVLSSLISSCCFWYISEDKNGYPRLEVIDGGNATGTIDPVTQMLVEGYAVLERDDSENPSIEAYFTAEQTEIHRKGIKNPDIYPNKAPYPLLVPMINRPDAVRPFGHSRISRACMQLTQSAMRTLKRSEVSAEFYSFPQKYVLGLDPEAETYDRWQATISSFLQYDKDEDGDHPVLGQFQQQSMAPYNEQLKTIASVFAGETGLTLDDLGFATSNPSTKEAIEASHERLRLMARRSQRTFSAGLLNVGYLAACVRDNYAYDRSQLYRTKAKWLPVFERDASQLSGIGDAVQKIQQSFPDYFDEDKLHEITGI